jgi:hypothetical protein
LKVKSRSKETKEQWLERQKEAARQDAEEKRLAIEAHFNSMSAPPPAVTERGNESPLQRMIRKAQATTTTMIQSDTLEEDDFHDVESIDAILPELANMVMNLDQQANRQQPKQQVCERRRAADPDDAMTLLREEARSPRSSRAGDDSPLRKMMLRKSRGQESKGAINYYK